jgi:hypothetical protein
MMFGRSFALLLTAAGFGLLAQGDVIIANVPSYGYFGLPISPINIHVGEEVGAVGWSQTATYMDVSINAYIAINGGPIQYWLTDSLNPSQQTVLFQGTADPAGGIGTANFIFSVPELGPGTYYFIARGLPNTADGWAASDPDCPVQCVGPPFLFPPAQTAPGVASLGSYSADVYSTSLPQGTFTDASAPWDFEVDGTLVSTTPEPATCMLAGIFVFFLLLARCARSLFLHRLRAFLGWEHQRHACARSGQIL